MPGTRSSARLSGSQPGSSPQTQSDKGSAVKRKADDSNSPSSAKKKRGRPSKADKEQKTLEETMPFTDEKNNQAESETNDVEPEKNGHQNGANGKTNGESHKESDSSKAEKADEESNSEHKNGDQATAFDHVKADVGEDGKTSKTQTESKDDGDTIEEAAIEEDTEREDAQPSNLLEKGIIYFFTRGRVGVDNPDSVQDLARSYFVLRPLPAGAKLTDGVIQDLNNNRLVALPKKVWPKSGKDKFMAFVEKGKTSMETLKKEFFSGSDYNTQTLGTRHTPDVTPVGEGVYAITTTGGGQGVTHLAYMLTIPSEIGDVQTDMGIKKKGSFVLSLKNPKSSGPANAQLPQGADYPDDVFEEFRGRGWMPVHPKHLDYVNAQILLIGENFEDSSNLDAAPKDEKDENKETPEEELEKLEGEDEVRVEHLNGDDTIFADLGISSKDYPSVMTTW
ncbi:Hypothetical protein R9X50_00327500 [Acrodontium crateriforme]|uniref:BTB domain transcription factor n=1 Tax=Acrodontium crateriforme TaxID=150365 RepID=A0AAQ3M5V7_9PEZI|nr:Hypothetical protein R9X50_00327500 [Acrodontium crateriforme]